MRFVFLLILSLAAHVLAEEWCQWRGPAFNGTSPETGLPDTLGDEQQRWGIDLPGPGEATPVICNGAVYLSGYDEANKTLFAMQVDAESGEIVWSKTIDTFEEMPKRNVIASPSAAADEKGAVFLFSTGVIVRYSREGKEIWKRDLVEEYGPFTLDWGYSVSPLLYNGVVYVAVFRKPDLPEGSTYSGSMTPYLLGLDADTGDVVFKVDRPTDAKNDFNDSYATPIPVTINGETGILLFGGSYITMHDPADGSERWRAGYMDIELKWGRLASTPSVQGNTICYGFPLGNKVVARDLEKTARGEGGILWEYEELTFDVSSPTFWDGHVYILQEKKKRLVCIDLETGVEKWVGQLDRGDTFYASMTAADGKLYIMNRKGFVTIAAADSSAFRILSTRDFNEKPSDSTITVANGKVYVRTAGHLYCFEK